MKLSYLFLICILSSAASAQWIKQPVNTTAGLRGLSVVDERVVWATGTGGTVIRTTDGGKSWKITTVPGAEKLDFRDVEAFDEKTAYILSIGNGDASRIYKTTDGGATWTAQFTNKNEKAFFDAIACWDARNCIAMSDPVDGHYLLISTSDGSSWKQIVSNVMPAAKDSEAAFAASGTCLYIASDRTVFLVSGGSDARVFRSADRGQAWTVADAPIANGTPGSGIFSIAMYDSRFGVIVGGDYEKPDEPKDTMAFTTDHGATWTAAPGLTGYRSSVAFINKKQIIAVGTNGTDLTTDGGESWKKIGTEPLNAVAAKGKKAVWAVGPNGMVVKLK